MPSACNKIHRDLQDPREGQRVAVNFPFAENPLGIGVIFFQKARLLAFLERAFPARSRELGIRIFLLS